MTICGEHSIVKYNSSERVAATLKCHSWLCPECKHERRNRLIRDAKRGQPNTYIVLTWRPEPGQTPEAAAALLARAWRIVVGRALLENRRDLSKRAVPYGAAPEAGWQGKPGQPFPRQVKLWDGLLPYLCVMERFKNGFPHLNVLCRSDWISQKWLSAQMAEICNSPVVSVSRVRDRNKIGAYCAKYVGKEPERIGTTKRYWSNRSYIIEHREKNTLPAGWWHEVYTTSRSVPDIAHDWYLQGWAYELTGLSHAVATRGPPKPSAPDSEWQAAIKRAFK